MPATKKRQRTVRFRIRAEVRRNYDSCDLDGVERYNFEMLLDAIVKHLRRHDGLPPDATAIEGEPNRYFIQFSVLRLTYLREQIPAAKGEAQEVVITVVQIICARPGRPVIEL